MSIAFSESTNNSGIVEQARSFCGVSSTQWPVSKIVNSANNWLDFVAGYAIGADKTFQWDDTNHTKLPEGTTSLVINQSDYSFLTDEQGNSIVTLTGISILINGKYFPLKLVDRNDDTYDPYSFGVFTGVPTSYDKISDNIVRLDFLPTATTAAGLKFFFQRTPSYFAVTDTTKSPGFSPLLHRGFVIASAYDCALTLGLPTLNGLSGERQLEVKKVVDYFANDRNNDRPHQVMTGKKILFM